MEKVEVSVDFVKQAYAAACNDWKRRIENELPDLFDRKNDVLNLESVKKFNNSYEPSSVIKFIGNDIVIPLPNCNKNWTYDAWDVAKEICEKFPEFYPYHNLPISKPNNITLKYR